MDKGVVILTMVNSYDLRANMVSVPDVSESNSVALIKKWYGSLPDEF